MPLLATASLTLVEGASSGGPDLFQTILSTGVIGVFLVLFMTGKLRTEGEVKRLEAELIRRDDIIAKKDDIIARKDAAIDTLQSSIADRVIPALTMATAQLGAGATSRSKGDG